MKAKYIEKDKELICIIIEYYEGNGCCSLVKFENNEKSQDNKDNNEDECYVETSSLIIIEK